MTSGRGILTLLAALLAAAGAGAEPELRWQDTIDLAVGHVVSPGTLAAGHAALEGVTSCAECHGGLRGTPDDLCIGCHEDVAQRLASRTGVHGSFTEPCSTCHVEHRGLEADLVGLDRENFSHERTLFPLRGAHLEVDCQACHERAHAETGRVAFRHFGLSFESCADCHADDDPHEGAFPETEDCGLCHGEQTWRARAVVLAEAPDGSGFEHDRDTGFPLHGRHVAVSCDGCHETAMLPGAAARPGTDAPTDCAGCHDDPHEEALGSNCGRCHSEAAWNGPDGHFDHTTQTDFPLDALHAPLDCAQCHEDNTFRTEGRKCSACHTVAAELQSGAFGGLAFEPDPHSDTVECRGCHPEAAASARLIDHERTCVGCHDPSYAGLLVTRKRILDELVVRAETELRRAELALSRDGSSAAAATETARQRTRLEFLARSGLHHADLAEAPLQKQSPISAADTPIDSPVQVRVRPAE